MTPAQVCLVRHFAGLDSDPAVKIRASTYRAALTRGWIEDWDQWPYHRTTPEGLAALAAHEAKGQ